MEELEKNYNFMVITDKGEKYRHFKYWMAKDFLDREGGRLYAYAHVSLKKTVRILIEWN